MDKFSNDFMCKIIAPKMEHTLKSLKELGLHGDALHKLLNQLERKCLPKGHLLIREGKLEKYFYFLEQGVARTFCTRQDRQVTICFNEAGSILLSLKSYFARQPGYESVDLLEDAVVYQIGQDALLSFFETDINLANWGRKMAELEFIKADERFMSQRFLTATERYHRFIEDYPNLMNRISLGHIASYLGISQVTLSRIRANFKQG
jgi:CRP-like cAMP-binding protein